MFISGYCAGQANNSLEKLGGKWAYGVFQNAMSDEMLLLPTGVEFVPLTFEFSPNESWSRFTKWESYKGNWLIGSEPHTDWDNYRPIPEIANIFMSQMKYIKTFDANAKFIVTCSTQGQLPYNPHSQNNFIDALWKFFPQEYKDMTTGFHCHLYPRWRSDDPKIRWSVKYLVEYVRKLRRWMTENGVGDKELWMSEFGYEGYFEYPDYGKCVRYLRRLVNNKYLSENLTRFAFYVANNRDGNGGSNGYLPLLDESGELTRLGFVYSKFTRKNNGK